MSIQQARQLLKDVVKHIKQQQPQLNTQQAWAMAYATPLQDALAITQGVH